MLLKHGEGKVEGNISHQHPCPFPLFLRLLQRSGDQLSHFKLVKWQNPYDEHLFNDLQEYKTTILHDLLMTFIKQSF